MIISQRCLIGFCWLLCMDLAPSFPVFQVPDQFSGLKFFRLLAINHPPCPPQLLQLLSLLKCTKEGNVDFYYGNKFIIFQKTWLKCCHSLYCWAALNSMLFSVWCRQKDLKKGTCADDIRWTLRLLAQAVITWFKCPGSFVTARVHYAVHPASGRLRYIINHIEWCMRKKDIIVPITL